MTFNLPRNSTLYKQTVETFRSSSTSIFAWKGVFDGYGTNLQNVTKDLRGIYYAEDGYELCQVDQSGAEALIVSYLCKPGNYRDLFLCGVKPHVFVALHVFADKWRKLCQAIDIDPFLVATIGKLKSIPGWKDLDTIIKSSDNWKPSERYYYIAKMICHASNYGMKAGAFQLNVLQKSEGKIVLTKQQAEQYLEHYHSLFPEIREWHQVVRTQLDQSGMLYNLFGYPRIATQAITETNIKEWYAFVPQSTVGVITHRALTEFQNWIDDNKKAWFLLGNCHDSYLAEAPVDEIRECATVMKRIMEVPLIGARGEKFNMRAEAQVGRNWMPAKENNPFGLREITL